MQNLNKPTTVLTLGAVGVITILGIRWYQKRKKYVPPTEWKIVGKVKNMYIYPMKSGTQLEIQTAFCTEIGFKMIGDDPTYKFQDRSLVVYNEADKEFRTARTYSKLLFIKVTPLNDEHFSLDAPGMPTLKVKVPARDEQNSIQLKYWKDESVSAFDCGPEPSKWVSTYILEKDSGLRLGFFDTQKRRDINGTHQNLFPVYPLLRNEAIGTFMDFSSYHIINQASVDELKQRLPDHNISINNFRPNIVVEGEDSPAFAEDDWNWVKINDVIMYVARPCTRCAMTTINPDTGSRYLKNEPLTTMKGYRQLKDVKNISQDGSSPVMGNSMGLLKTGQISVGDVVYAAK